MGNLEAGRRGAYASLSGRMTSALDRLITLALHSDDPNLQAAAEAVQSEHKRGRGRPKAKLPGADDPDVVFTVLDLLHNRRYTGEVYFVDGEPVAVTRPRKESETAIAKALADELAVSPNTARRLVREVIAKLQPRVPLAEAFSLIGQLELAQKPIKK